MPVHLTLAAFGTMSPMPLSAIQWILFLAIQFAFQKPKFKKFQFLTTLPRPDEVAILLGVYSSLVTRLVQGTSPSRAWSGFKYELHTGVLIPSLSHQTATFQFPPHPLTHPLGILVAPAAQTPHIRFNKHTRFLQPPPSNLSKSIKMFSSSLIILALSSSALANVFVRAISAISTNFSRRRSLIYSS